MKYFTIDKKKCVKLIDDKSDISQILKSRDYLATGVVKFPENDIFEPVKTWEFEILSFYSSDKESSNEEDAIEVIKPMFEKYYKEHIFAGDIFLDSTFFSKSREPIYLCGVTACVLENCTIEIIDNCQIDKIVNCQIGEVLYTDIKEISGSTTIAKLDNTTIDWVNSNVELFDMVDCYINKIENGAFIHRAEDSNISRLAGSAAIEEAIGVKIEVMSDLVVIGKATNSKIKSIYGNNVRILYLENSQKNLFIVLLM